MYRKFFLFCFSCFIIGETFAQEVTGEQKILTDTINPLSLPEEYVNFELPPLQTLLDNVGITNPQVLQNNANIEAAEYDLKIEKRKWLSYLSARAGYTYGILGTYSDFETAYNPLTTTYTGSSQHSYFIGANLSVPIGDLISRGVSSKRQKKIIEQAEYNREAIYNMIKIEVVELYSNIQAAMTILNGQAETLVAFNANYKITANSFMNGKASPYDLSIVKNEQSKSLAEYATTRAQLMSMVMRLEIITGTKIINNK